MKTTLKWTMLAMLGLFLTGIHAKAVVFTNTSNPKAKLPSAIVEGLGTG